MPIESPMFRVELGLGPALQVLRMALNVSFFFNCFSTHFSHWIYPCLPTNLKPEWPSPLPAKSSKWPPANTPQLARSSTTSRANLQPKTRRSRCSTRPPTARPRRPISISPTADQLGRLFSLSPLSHVLNFWIHHDLDSRQIRQGQRHLQGSPHSPGHGAPGLRSRLWQSLCRAAAAL